MDLLDFAMKNENSSFWLKRVSARMIGTALKTGADRTEKKLKRLQINVPEKTAAKEALFRRISDEKRRRDSNPSD